MGGKRFVFIILIWIAPFFPAAGQGTDPYKPDFRKPQEVAGYKLSWHDEFNKDGRPDPGNWEYEYGFKRNEELQWYQPENARCENGLLVIEGRRERVPNPNYKAYSSDWRTNRKYASYTSACLQTRERHEFHYGRIEVRARIDTARGAWPAIWTLGIKGPWPLNGEVDIMEFYRVDGTPTILANTAWGRSEDGGPVWNTQRYPFTRFASKDPEWAEKFHIWTMEWNEDSIKICLDDAWVNLTLLDKTVNPDGSNPFVNPQYLLLNLAIGAHGGDPGGTIFPIRYEVDYVRYYEKIPE